MRVQVPDYNQNLGSESNHSEGAKAPLSKCTLSLLLEVALPKERDLRAGVAGCCAASLASTLTFGLGMNVDAKVRPTALMPPAWWIAAVSALQLVPHRCVDNQ
jgi:hypothetical protein